nr:glutathione hydrolase 7-like isoform X1 [Lytechinus pictus]
MASGDLGIPSSSSLNQEGLEIRIAPPKQDKHALINPKERAPLKENVIVQQELICGYDGLRFIIVTSLVFALAVTIGMVISIIAGIRQIDPHGAIATDVEVCSDIGADVLKRGGHAVDAAVAAAFCLGVVHGHYSGLGGGGFLLVGNPITNDLNGFDFRETAPSGSSANMFENNPQAALQGGLAVATPGELKGLEAAWKQYGKLKWSELVEPSIELAENGFQITQQLAADISETDFSWMSESLRELFEKKKFNDTIHRPSLANLLRLIAKQGSDVLYNNDTIAQQIIDTVGGAGGILSLEDIHKYTSQPATPIQSSYKLHRIFSMPAPSSGASILSSLHTMSALNLSISSDTPASSYHQVIEISKFIAAMARQLGDPRQTPTTANLTDSMLSDNTTERVRDMVNDTATYDYTYYFQGDVFQQLFATRATSLVSVADGNNNLVSLTSTLNSPFGSGLMTPDGIILNNAMNSFNWDGKYLTPNTVVPQANAISPGRRPMSNMAPLLTWSEESPCLARYAISGIGPTSIQSAPIDVALKLLSLNVSLSNDVERDNRIFPSLYQNLVNVEDGLSPSIQEGLEELGHVVQSRRYRLGVVNVASEAKDKLTAHSDTRRLGAKASDF